MRSRRTGFTTRAASLLAAGGTAVLCGLIFGEVDLVRAGILAAAVPVASAVLVHRSRVRIANRRRVEPARAEAGQAITVHLTITNRSLLRTSALMLEDALPETVNGRARFVADPLLGHEARPVSYRIPALGRGRYRAGPLQMRLSDPFGMIDLTRSFTATSEFMVAPVVEPLPAIEPPRSDDLGENAGSRSVGTHGADDQSTREYRTGDDLRKIHWRSSARTGALMVRQEERPWQGHSTVLIDVRSAAHERSLDDPDDPDNADGATAPGPVDLRLTSSFEWAVSATATIGSHLLLAGRKLSLVGDPLRSERLRFGDARRLTDHLAEVHESTRPDIGAAAELLRAAARDSTLIAVLGRLEPRDLRALADAHARGRSSPAYALLLDVDSWTPPVTAPPASARPPTAPAMAAPPVTAWPLTGGLLRRPSEGGRRDLAATAEVLRSAGWRVVIVSRGQTVAQAWQLLLSGKGSGTSLGSAAGRLPSRVPADGGVGPRLTGTGQR